MFVQKNTSTDVIIPRYIKALSLNRTSAQLETAHLFGFSGGTDTFMIFYF